MAPFTDTLNSRLFIAKYSGANKRIYVGRTFLRLVSTEISKQCAFTVKIKVKCLSAYFNSFFYFASLSRLLNLH